MGVGILYGLQAIWWQFGSYDTAEVFTPMEVITDKPLSQELVNAGIYYDANNEETVPQGGVLKLFLSFDKQTSLAPRVDRNIICESGNTYQVTSPNTDSSRPSGQFTATLNFTISDDIPVGEKCFFQFQNTYQVNPIRTINKSWVSEPFTIIEKE